MRVLLKKAMTASGSVFWCLVKIPTRVLLKSVCWWRKHFNLSEHLNSHDSSKIKEEKKGSVVVFLHYLFTYKRDFALTPCSALNGLSACCIYHQPHYLSNLLIKGELNETSGKRLWSSVCAESKMHIWFPKCFSTFNQSQRELCLQNSYFRFY